MGTRHLDCGLVELKFDAGTSGVMSFAGYGAFFGNVDAYGDVIKAGATARFLAEAKAGRAPWPLMLLQHGGAGLSADDMTPIGVWTEMTEDSRGLRVTGQLADTERGREVYALLRMEPRPALSGLSIGYVARTWQARSKPDEPKRTLTDIELVEVSVVSRPANRQAQIDEVKRIGELRSMDELIDYLRQRGMGAVEARKFAFKAHHLSHEAEAAEKTETLLGMLRRTMPRK